jgi:hypothetical protein
VLLEVFLGGRDDLDGGELKSFLLEAVDDVTDEPTLENLSQCLVFRGR